MKSGRGRKGAALLATTAPAETAGSGELKL